MCEDIKIGLIKKRRLKTEGGDEHLKYIAVCSCGTVAFDLDMGRRNSPKCEKCGNTKFLKNSLDKAKNRTLIPHVEVLYKDDKCFKIRRTNVSVIHDEFYNISFKKNMVQVFTYNVVDNSMELTKNGKNAPMTEDNLNRFFQGIYIENLIELISTKTTYPLYHFVWMDLSSRGWNKVDRFWFGLKNLKKHKHIQILSNAGFKHLRRFKYDSNIINRDATTPKDILGVPKFMLKYIKDNSRFEIGEIKKARNALEKLDGNIVKELFEIVYDEGDVSNLCMNFDIILELYDKYKYTNLKKLILYLFRDTRLMQGITSPNSSATYLRDYASMSTKMGLEFEKYPKSLKKEHDIVQMNYKVKENEYKIKSFMDIVNKDSYKNLEYIDKKSEYSIVTPNEINDIVNEGNELSHCVASYVDDIIDDKCKILFMRKTDDIKTPLVTIEVRKDNIRQARGYRNKSVGTLEKEFISKWAKEKNLQEKYY